MVTLVCLDLICLDLPKKLISTFKMEKDLSHSVLFRFSGKIIEGKYFENVGDSNVFAVLRIDNQEIHFQKLPGRKILIVGNTLK